jgi:F0F1-type ATP synthase alpha subunit
MNSNHPEVLKAIADVKDLTADVESSLKAAIEEFKVTVSF